MKSTKRLESLDHLLEEGRRIFKDHYIARNTLGQMAFFVDSVLYNDWLLSIRAFISNSKDNYEELTSIIRDTSISDYETCAKILKLLAAKKRDLALMMNPKYQNNNNQLFLTVCKNFIRFASQLGNKHRSAGRAGIPLSDTRNLYDLLRAALHLLSLNVVELDSPNQKLKSQKLYLLPNEHSIFIAVYAEGKNLINKVNDELEAGIKFFLNHKSLQYAYILIFDLESRAPNLERIKKTIEERYASIRIFIYSNKNLE